MDIESSPITVVLPTKNEAHNIAQFLQSMPPGVRLIVLDDSDDGTTEKIKELRPECTHIVHLPGGVSLKRQYGAQIADTEWLLFTDADIQFSPDYFHNLNCYLKEDLIFGPKMTAGGHEFYYRIFSLGQSISSFIGIPAASASNMIVRKKALLHIGGFDTNLPCNEDTDLAFRLVMAGYKYQWNSNLVVFNTDHRRLERGILFRFKHSLIRGLLLYMSLRWNLPKQILYTDWGYWQSGSTKETSKKTAISLRRKPK